MPTTGPGNLATFIPTFAHATGALQVEFSRNPASFALNRYVQVIPTSQMVGYYLQIDTDEPIRASDPNLGRWALGTDRPRGMSRPHEFTPFACERFAKSFTLPRESVQQAAWDVIASHARMAATWMMTLRTVRAGIKLTNAANYSADNTATTGTLWSGGNWGASTPTDGWVEEGFRNAAFAINKATGGVVSAKDIVAVMSPETAGIIARSPELRDLVRYHAAATNYQRGDQQFATYGLPSQLFGIEVAVEDAVVEYAKKGGASSRRYLYTGPSDEARVLFLARPGGLVGPENATMSFASMCMFAFEDLVVESREQEWDRRHEGSVVDNTAFELTAPAAACYIGNVAA